MKCPRCGTNNGRTNRFCRGCGLRLEDLAPKEPERQAEPSAERDEVALGEELFEVWQVYSRGDLDDALARAQKILQKTPDSASAHSILALIFERKADRAAQNGSEEEAKDFLKLAVAEYERIIDLNPDSAADREKLAALRMRIAGRATVRQKARYSGFRALVAAVPVSVWAAFGTFLVVLMTAIILIPGGGSDEVRPTTSHRPPKPAQAAARASQAETAAAPESRVYVFPSPSTTTYPLTPTAPPPAQQPAPSARPTTQPAKLPPIPGANVKIVPESKKPAEKPEKQVAPTPKPPEPEEKPSNRPEGDTALARAIELDRQGATEDAVKAAEEAIRLYQADIDAGRNPNDARRGQETARKFIQSRREAQ